jgi:hypothetical protein
MWYDRNVRKYWTDDRTTMKVNWETRGNKLLRHVHTDWLQTWQEIFRRTKKCVRISDLWDETRNLQRAKHENYNKKKEYYINTGILRKTGILHKTGTLHKTRMLHQNRNSTIKHHVALFNVLRTKIKLNRIWRSSPYREVNIPSRYKINNFILYSKIIAVCSQIHTKHINTAVWAERRIAER